MAKNNQPASSEKSPELFVPPSGKNLEVPEEAVIEKVLGPVAPLVGSGQFKFNLAPTQERCPKCSGYVLAISGQTEEAQAFLNNWEYWCAHDQAVVIPVSLASVTFARPMAAGQVGILVTWPLPLSVAKL